MDHEEYRLDELVTAYFEFVNDPYVHLEGMARYYDARFAALERCFGIVPGIHEAYWIATRRGEDLRSYLEERLRGEAGHRLGKSLRDAGYTVEEPGYREMFADAMEREADRPEGFPNTTLVQGVSDALRVVIKAIQRTRSTVVDPFTQEGVMLEGLPSPFVVAVRPSHAKLVAEDASRIKRHSQAIVRDVLLKLWPGLRSKAVSADELHKAGHPTEKPVYDVDDLW